MKRLNFHQRSSFKTPFRWKQMGLSKNGGFSPNHPFLRGISIINHSFWGFSPYFWKHPNLHQTWKSTTTNQHFATSSERASGWFFWRLDTTSSVSWKKNIFDKHVCQGWASGEDGIICLIKLMKSLCSYQEKGEEKLLKKTFLSENCVFLLNFFPYLLNDWVALSREWGNEDIHGYYTDSFPHSVLRASQMKNPLKKIGSFHRHPLINWIYWGERTHLSTHLWS